jgi:cell division protein FtsZ
MEKRGKALIGIGIGVGDNRATEAARQAVSSPLLETSINGATDAIINVTGGNNLTLFEVEEAAEVIRSSANTDINTIFGAVINENLNDEIIVTVIATGFEDQSEPLYHSYTRSDKNGHGVITDTEEIKEFEPTPAVEEDDDDDDDMIPSFLRNRGSF